MAVQGDLKDMNLPSLVQMICLERRRSALVLRRRGKEGTILFEDGQIVHAQVGSLVGEEAVYQLLHWTDGAFQVSNHVTISGRTVTLPWSHLLLEGLRRLDEQGIRNPAPDQDGTALSTAEIEWDNALEDNLILLLSRLEHSRSQLVDGKAQKRFSPALQSLTEMANHVIAFAEEHLDTGNSFSSLTAVWETTTRAYPQLRMLQVNDNRLSAEIASNLYSGGHHDPAERQEMFRQVTQGVAAILEAYFSLIITHFRSPSVERWRETCTTFLAELTQVTESIQS